MSESYLGSFIVPPEQRDPFRYDRTLPTLPKDSA
jgi:hypothetical protein